MHSDADGLLEGGFALNSVERLLLFASIARIVATALILLGWKLE